MVCGGPFFSFLNSLVQPKTIDLLRILSRIISYRAADVQCSNEITLLLMARTLCRPERGLNQQHGIDRARKIGVGRLVVGKLDISVATSRTTRNGAMAELLQCTKYEVVISIFQCAPIVADVRPGCHLNSVLCDCKSPNAL
jgi:hypothetical protein